MPTLAEFIRADKSDVETGSWETGHIKPSLFPLSKSEKFKRVAEDLECDDDEERFGERLTKIVKQKPREKPE